jgi:hypothetical protein
MLISIFCCFSSCLAVKQKLCVYKHIFGRSSNCVYSSVISFGIYNKQLNKAQNILQKMSKKFGEKVKKWIFLHWKKWYSAFFSPKFSGNFLKYVFSQRDVVILPFAIESDRRHCTCLFRIVLSVLSVHQIAISSARHIRPCEIANRDCIWKRQTSPKMYDLIRK